MSFEIIRDSFILATIISIIVNYVAVYFEVYPFTSLINIFFCTVTLWTILFTFSYFLFIKITEKFKNKTQIVPSLESI